MQYRIEKDFLGRVKIPAGAYYGPTTQRTLNTFKISGIRINKNFINTYVMLKEATAMANMKSGKLDQRIGNAIIKACGKILKGGYDNEFDIDVFQAGAGTSTNMNVNEVIANIAAGILKGKKGDKNIVSPNDHVNMSQSTNDTYPTNIQLCCHYMLNKQLMPALNKLRTALSRKSSEFSSIVKIGRTHLQDAVPITLGQEFSGYAGAITRLVGIFDNAGSMLMEIPIGGTAVGTGINTPKDYRANIIKELNRIFNSKFRPSRNIFTDIQNQIAELELCNALSTAAITLGKIANDLRLLGSGPRAGINELLLPEVLPGSSIMPGKVNPSVAEMLNMACFEVIGNCAIVREAAASGQLELNVFTPIIAFNLLFSIEIISNAINTFSEKMVKGIKINKSGISKHLEMNLSIATALNPYIGYSKAAKIARKAGKENKSIKQVCIELGVLDKETLDRILNPKNLI